MILKAEVVDNDDDDDQSVEAGGPRTGVRSTSSKERRRPGTVKNVQPFVPNVR